MAAQKVLTLDDRTTQVAICWSIILGVIVLVFKVNPFTIPFILGALILLIVMGIIGTRGWYE